MTKILSPKPAIERIEKEIKGYKLALGTMRPKLGVLIDAAPDEGASSYLRQIRRNGEKYGVDIEVHQTSNEYELTPLRQTMADNRINGVMLLSNYSPLIKDKIEPHLDVDAMSSNTLGRFYVTGHAKYAPITAEAVCRILEYNGIDIQGKRVGIIGRSLRVGRPVAEIVLQKNGTPTIYHSYSDLTFAKNDDIIVSAIGKPKALKRGFFRKGQVVVDVGINVDENGKLCGDVDFSSVIAAIGDEGAITPVPGGVGTLTNALLFYRLFKSAAGDTQCV